METLNWIPAASFCATEKWFLYYLSVSCEDYYAIKFELIKLFPGGKIFLPQHWMNPEAIDTKVIWGIQGF